MERLTGHPVAGGPARVAVGQTTRGLLAVSAVIMARVMSRVRVVVDPKSALYVTGSELDYVDALQDGGFKVKNPNAATSCSCGESFSA